MSENEWADERGSHWYFRIINGVPHMSTSPYGGWIVPDSRTSQRLVDALDAWAKNNQKQASEDHRGQMMDEQQRRARATEVIMRDMSTKELEKYAQRIERFNAYYC